MKKQDKGLSSWAMIKHKTNPRKKRKVHYMALFQVRKTFSLMKHCVTPQEDVRRLLICQICLLKSMEYRRITPRRA